MVPALRGPRHQHLQILGEGVRAPVMRFFLMPGSLVCDAVGLREDSDHRQILRMFLNTLFWGTASVITAVFFFS